MVHSWTHKNKAPFGPFTTMNQFWFHSSPNHCDSKTLNKTRRHRSQDQNKNLNIVWDCPELIPKFSIFCPKNLGTKTHVQFRPRMAHAMCHSPRVPCDIHMTMPCVTRHQCLKKLEIFIVSESNKIKWDN